MSTRAMEVRIHATSPGCSQMTLVLFREPLDCSYLIVCIEVDAQRVATSSDCAVVRIQGYIRQATCTGNVTLRHAIC